MGFPYTSAVTILDFLTLIKYLKNIDIQYYFRYLSIPKLETFSENDIHRENNITPELQGLYSVILVTKERWLCEGNKVERFCVSIPQRMIIKTVSNIQHRHYRKIYIFHNTALQWNLDNPGVETGCKSPVAHIDVNSSQWYNPQCWFLSWWSPNDSIIAYLASVFWQDQPVV